MKRKHKNGWGVNGQKQIDRERDRNIETDIKQIVRQIENNRREDRIIGRLLEIRNKKRK